MRVSKQEIANAKQYDVLSYLQIADPGEVVKTAAGEYRLRSHDSFVISNGLWHWYSRSIGGRSAVDYLIKVKNYSFPMAVKEVNRALEGSSPSFFTPEKKEKKLKLPEKNNSSDRAFAYLISRGIDRKLVEKLIEKGMIYENRDHGSVVFVGYDEYGIPRHGAYRSTDNSGYKGDFYGSNKRFCFRLERKTCPKFFVYESAIDLLSYVTICKIYNIDTGDRSFISTAGISAGSEKIPAALSEYLKRHPETEEIHLHLDNDWIGQTAAEEIKLKLQDKYKVNISVPPKGKDYNEFLMMIRKGRAKDER